MGLLQGSEPQIRIISGEHLPATVLPDFQVNALPHQIRLLPTVGVRVLIRLPVPWRCFRLPGRTENVRVSVRVQTVMCRLVYCGFVLLPQHQ